MYTSFFIPDVTLLKRVTSGIEIVSIVSTSHRAAPVSEIFFPVCLFFCQLHVFLIRPDESGETEGFRRLGLAGMINAGDSQPALILLQYEQEMMVAVIAVKEEAVVCQPPFAPLQLGDISALDLDAAQLPLLGAALRDDTTDVREVDLTRAAMLIGSEGRGLSEAALAACDGTIRIPMGARCESLNAAVAAATLLWEGYRQCAPGR